VDAIAEGPVRPETAATGLAARPDGGSFGPRKTPRTLAGPDIPGLGTGYIADAFWNRPANAPIRTIQARWTVPPPPATESGQVIYLFDGIESPGTTDSLVLQPVLQWNGESAEGAGGTWTVSSYLARGSDQVLEYTPPVAVDVGFELFGIVTLTQQQAVLDQTSPAAPALASLGQALYLAWTGTGNNRLNVMYSADGGNTFGQPFTSAQTSPAAPALSAYDGSLFIAWTGAGNNQLNVAQVDLRAGAPADLSQPVELPQTSPAAPALASLGSKQYLAWTGTGNNQLNLVSFADGSNFGTPYSSAQTSPAGPALCAFDGNLFIAWTGTGNNQLNVAQVELDSDGQPAGIGLPAQLDQTSHAGPGLASLDGVLYLTWTGTGNNQLNIISSTDGVSFSGGPFISAETSPDGPALQAGNGNLFTAWTGTGNNQVNVAQLVAEGGAIGGMMGIGSVMGYQCEFANVPGTQLNVTHVPELTQAVVVLEAHALQRSTDYPDAWETSFTQVGVDTTGPSEPTVVWTPIEGVTDCGQSAVIVSQGARGAQIDLYYSAGFFANQAIVSQTSLYGPALASLGGVVYMAWTGSGNNQLNIGSSADNFSSPLVLAQTSPAAPALCVSNATLFMAWTAAGSNQLSAAAVQLGGDGTPAGIGDPLSLPQTSPAGPALVSLGDTMYLAWTGTDNHQLNIASADEGLNFGAPLTSSQTSPSAPGLGVSNNGLFITWTGTGNSQLNVAQVQLSGAVAASIGEPVVLPQTSTVGPALASLGNVLYLGWAGPGNNQLNILTSTDNGAVFGNIYTSPQTSPAAPGLLADNGTLLIAWTGAGNNELNLADVDYLTGFFSDQVTLDQTSPAGPALAALGNVLYLAWTGTGNNQLNIAASGDGGITFEPPVVWAQTSPFGPALCVTEAGTFFVAWTGTGNHQLNVAPAGTGNPVVLSQTSLAGPALASLNGVLYLAWTATGNNQLNVASSADGVHFAAMPASSQTSPVGPALCASNGSLFIAWTGSGDDQLNVAQVQLDNEGTPLGLGPPVTLAATSTAGPVLASLDSVLYLAWTGVGNNELNIVTSIDNGASFGAATPFGVYTSSQTSPASPGLCVYNGSLFITWTGAGNNQLNVAMVAQPQT
jgi:hypothetical protein